MRGYRDASLWISLGLSRVNWSPMLSFVWDPGGDLRLPHYGFITPQSSDPSITDFPVAVEHYSKES